MARRKGNDWLGFGQGKGYVHRVHYPLQCLVFITPLLLIYQIGSIGLFRQWTPDQAAPTHVIAFVLMLKFFALFGAAGNYLPLLTIVAILVAWHLARRDKWTFEPKLYLGMAGESILWAIPVFVIGLAMLKHTATGQPPAGAGTSMEMGGLPWQTAVILSVGAGIYEELLFRLIGITVLNIILVDIFEIKLSWAIPLIILISAGLFAAYHFLGDAKMTPSYVFFLTAFGVYCAAIFMYRGFGIAVGTHAVYDIIVVLVTIWRQSQGS